MHTVKLTVLIDDPSDIDMEVRVVAPDMTAAAGSATVTPLKPRTAPAVAATPVAAGTADDEYILGGYAGI